eukprot:s2973_g1.t2
MAPELVAEAKSSVSRIENFEAFLSKELAQLHSRLLSAHESLAPVSPSTRKQSKESEIEQTFCQLRALATPTTAGGEDAHLEPAMPPPLLEDISDRTEEDTLPDWAVSRWQDIVEKLRARWEAEEPQSPHSCTGRQSRMRVTWRLQGESTLWDAYSKQGSIDFNGILGKEKGDSNPDLHEVVVKTSTGCSACLGYLVLHPYGWPKFSWSIILLLAVLWDAVTIPLQLFDLGAFSATLDAVNTATIFFWLADIPVSCFTAVDRDGLLDFRPRSCIRDYTRGWCLPDVLMVLGDVIVSIVGANSVAAAAGTQGLRVSRLIRLSRLVRLVRLYKASATVESLVDYVRSPLIVVLIGLAKLILFILFVNHYIACAWCAMAYFSDASPTWADGHVKARDDFRELYALSLHWSLTQFTPSTQDIGPSNIGERIFAAGVVIFALIVFSSFVSSITNQMNQIRTWNSKTIELDAVLRHFLKSRKISTQLGVRITNFFKVSQKQKAKTPLESISFLANLPESLKIHLYSEIFLPAFKTSGLFSRVMKVDYRLLSKTCSRAFKEHYCPPEIDIFIEGAAAPGVLIVHRGEMIYQPRALSRFTHLSAVKPVRLQKGLWISEASLWCVWSYAGSLRAETEPGLHSAFTLPALRPNRFCAHQNGRSLKARQQACDFHLLDSDAFSRVCQSHGGALVAILRKLAVLFINYMEERAQESKPITDMPLSDEEWESLLDRSDKLEKMKTMMMQLALPRPDWK